MRNMADLIDEYESISSLPPHISSGGHGGAVGDSNLMSGPGTGVISGSEVTPASRLYDIGIATGIGSFDRSSSSSSSEDDEEGGRRKKGLRQKIKEKLGVEKEEETTTASGPGLVHEKKSMMKTSFQDTTLIK